MKRVIDSENSASSLKKGSIGKKISRSLARYNMKRGTVSSMKNETEVKVSDALPEGFFRPDSVAARKVEYYLMVTAKHIIEGEYPAAGEVVVGCHFGENSGTGELQLSLTIVAQRPFSGDIPKDEFRQAIAAVRQWLGLDKPQLELEPVGNVSAFYKRNFHPKARFDQVVSQEIAASWARSANVMLPSETSGLPSEVKDAAPSEVLKGYPSRVTFQNFVDAGVARSQDAVGMSRDEFTGLLEDAIVFGVSQDDIDAFERYKVESFGDDYESGWSELDDVEAFADFASGDARRKVFEYIRAEAPEVLVQYGKYLTGIKSKYRLGDSAKVKDAAEVDDYDTWFFKTKLPGLDVTPEEFIDYLASLIHDNPYHASVAGLLTMVHKWMSLGELHDFLEHMFELYSPDGERINWEPEDELSELLRWADVDLLKRLWDKLHEWEALWREDSAKVSDAAGSRIAELYPLYFANSGEAEDSLLAIRSGNLYYLYDDSAAVAAGVLRIPLQGFADEDGYHSCVVLSESQLAQAEEKFGSVVVYSAPVSDSTKVQDGVYYPKGRAMAGPEEGNYRYVNILNDDSEFFDLCIREGWIDADTPIEEFDSLAVFEGDPNMLKVDGETGYFMDVEDGGQQTVYYWIDDYDGKAEEILRAFYENRLELFDSSVAIQNWDAWDRISDGVAYRGGSGYVYAIYEYKGGSESVSDSANGSALEGVVSSVVVRTAESEFSGSSASVDTEFEQNSAGYYMYLSVELETSPELAPNLEASEDFFDAVGKALDLSSAALQTLIRSVAVSAEETRYGDYVALLTSQTWLSKQEYGALVSRLHAVSDSSTSRTSAKVSSRVADDYYDALEELKELIGVADLYDALIRWVGDEARRGIIRDLAEALDADGSISQEEYDSLITIAGDFSADTDAAFDIIDGLFGGDYSILFDVLFDDISGKDRQEFLRFVVKDLRDVITEEGYERLMSEIDKL